MISSSTLRVTMEGSRDRRAPTREMLLYLLKSKGPQTATELAEQLQITPVAVRQHLQGLGERDLVGAIEERRAVGRPVRRWHLSEAGQSQFPDSHAEFAATLLEAVDAVFGIDGVERLIEERARRQIERYRRLMPGPEAPIQRRIEALAEIRGREGYMAEWSNVDDGRWTLVENHCPIGSAARSCGNLCEREPRVFQAVLGEAVEIKRTEHLLDGARRCVYEIVQLEGPSSRRPSSDPSRDREAVQPVENRKATKPNSQQGENI